MWKGGADRFSEAPVHSLDDRRFLSDRAKVIVEDPKADNVQAEGEELIFHVDAVCGAIVNGSIQLVDCAGRA